MPYSAWAGQVLLSQINLGQHKDGPLPMWIHLTDQVRDYAPLCIHTAIWWQKENIRHCVTNVMLKEEKVTKNLLFTLNAKDDGIGVLHVGPAYAEDGLLGV